MQDIAKEAEQAILALKNKEWKILFKDQSNSEIFDSCQRHHKQGKCL